MIPPIIAAQTATPVASIQQNAEAQSVLQGQNAQQQVRKEERQVRESVVNKEEPVFYQQRHDAKEEGKNKYVNLYTNKKKRVADDSTKEHETPVNRVNFDIKI